MKKMIVRFQLMGTFLMTVNGLPDRRIGGRTGKATAVMQYLMVRRGQKVSTSELMETFWSDEDIDNPESALKTLISRQRAALNEICDGLGKCIVSGRGTYGWVSLDNVEMDVYELWDALAAAEDETASAEDRDAAAEVVQRLYAGDLLDGCSHNEWARPAAAGLLRRYGDVACAYAYRLLSAGHENEAIRVCRRYIQAYNLDDRIYCTLITALTNLGKTEEATETYREIANLHYRCIGDKPGEALQRLYLDSVQPSSKEFNIDILCNELKDADNADRAYVCEYPVFKALFNFHVRNLDRMGLSMTMGIITLRRADGSELNPAELDDGILKLLNLLQQNLRKSDAVTRFSSSVVAVLLAPPLSDFDTMMKRVRRVFAQQYGRSGLEIVCQSCDLGDQNNRIAESIREAGSYGHNHR